MADTYDINLLPLNRAEGRDYPSLPGVHVALPPRRTARGRKNDRFIAYLHVESGPALSREQQNNLLNSLERGFYSTAGSATSVLKGLAENLNEALMNRNLRGSEPTVVYLTLMTARDDMLYMAQCGPSHGFLITRQNIEHLHDPHTSGRGLGVSRTPQVRYFQTELTEGALLLITPRLPATWKSSTIKESAGRPLASAARRYLADAGDNLQAIVLESRRGAGALNLLRAPAVLQGAAEPAPRAADPTPHAAPPTARAAERPAAQIERPSRQPLEVPEPEPLPQPVVRTRPADSVATEVPPTFTRDDEEATPRTRSMPSLGPAFARVRQAMGPLVRRTGSALRAGLSRILPGDELFTLPTSTMAIIAVVVPVILTTIALVVYLNLGRDQGYQSYLEQAQASALTAAAAEEKDAASAAWQNVIFYLDRAEIYRTTSDTEALRAQAQTALDDLEGLFRLNFSPAIAGTLNPNVRIRQMAVNGTDLYLLDANSGSVLRAWLTGSGYELDPDFSCGPAQYGAYIVGPLVDMAALPINEFGATVLAMDANGNLLYCIPEEAPLAAPLVPPDSAWGNPVAMSLDNDSLYILDPLTNAVWRYSGEDGQFRNPPRFFFSAEVPRLDTAIDLTASGDDLFLLHSDGHYTLCVFSLLDESPTRCEDPATYTDSRPGRTSGPQMEGATFYKLLRTEPPEPSLFFLDPITRSIYHFSMRVNLVRQYRVQTGFPDGIATAFAISPTRAVFLALDNQVYISYLP
ncbi:MAG: hypothetical protein EPO32_09175 [Anaerolineae bacterium]|nr:MAG: hypothetical protein EPO32_09175 [Anaerolineae bacterium]